MGFCFLIELLSSLQALPLAQYPALHPVKPPSLCSQHLWAGFYFKAASDVIGPTTDTAVIITCQPPKQKSHRPSRVANINDSVIHTHVCQARPGHPPVMWRATV